MFKINVELRKILAQQKWFMIKKMSIYVDKRKYVQGAKFLGHLLHISAIQGMYRCYI